MRANYIVDKSFSNFNFVIEAWRGFAAVLVMICHYRIFWVTGPSYFDLTATGVDLFFVLSGYVFAPTILTNIGSYWAFMLRRLFRMYPLYLVALFTYAVLRASSGQSQWEPLLAHLSMLQSSISPAITFFYNPAFWSLPAEWEFYCLMPLLIWCVRARGIWLCIVVATVARVCFGFWVMAPSPENPFFNWASWLVVNLPGILSEFLLGAVVYILINQYGQFNFYRKWVAVLLCILLSLIIYFYPLVWLPNLAPQWGNLVGLLAAFCYAIVLWLSLTIESPPSKWVHILCLKIGTLSYSIYLFHNASPEIIRYFHSNLTSLQMTCLSLALTFFLAAILHRLVEAPCRSYGRYLSEKIKGAQIQSK